MKRPIKYQPKKIKEMLITIQPELTDIVGFLCESQQWLGFGFGLEDLISSLVIEEEAMSNVVSFAIELADAVSDHYGVADIYLSESIMKEVIRLGEYFHDTFERCQLYENSIFPYQFDGKFQYHVLFKRVW